MNRVALLLSLAALLASACAAAPSAPASPSGSLGGIARCADVPQISAPATAYRDSPVYVGNEMPTETVLAWATGKPGYEGIWIDRQHFGWITIAFSTDADTRQAELEREFPGVGVVAVAVDWTARELEDLQQQVHRELSPLFSVTTGSLINHGVVSIGVPVLTAERVAIIEERFGAQRVCVEGGDPADAPAPGPQAPEGDGWRLLADELTGEPYRTGIASDAASLRELWRRVGLSGEAPEVDFQTHVVIWFGAVYGSSCPNLRLDDVVVDQGRRVVHAAIVNVDAPAICTGDANPRAYVVGLERAKLPMAPFAIQLGADDPPAGVPEERTVVDADLRAPGSVAAPGQIHGDPNLPRPQIEGSGTVIEPGFESPYRLSVHCGVEWLGQVNSIWWRTDVPAAVPDWVPAEWKPVVADQEIVASILLEGGPDPTVTATANGHAVVYRPSRDAPPGCD